MSAAAPLPIALPILAAGGAIVLRHRIPWPRALGLSAIAFHLGLAIAFVFATRTGEVLAVQVGDWPAPFAIALAVDPFSALMLLVASMMVATCTIFAIATGEDHRPFFYPLVLVLLAGVSGAFITADLFNLFVFFEVMLIASYVLLTMRGGASQVVGGTVYVTTNLLASTIFLLGTGVMYGVTGTVNMAELARVAPGSPGAIFAGALLLVSFGIKASLVPVHGWLPSSYPRATPAVAALFSGLLTKVGVYALFRIYSVVFDGAPQFRTALLVMAAATMLAGVFAAMGAESMRLILSFHIVSQVGYMIMGLGLFGVLGLAGGIFYILHHIVVKTSLFLAAGAVEVHEGTGVLNRLGGAARRHPLLAAGFAFSAFSLAGLPPFSGFFAKLVLVRAAFSSGSYAIAGISILVSFFTLLSMLKIWNAAFWGDRPDGRADSETDAASRRAGIVAPGVLLAVVSVVMGLFAQQMFELSRTAAAVLVDTTPYVDAILGGAP